MIPLPAVQAAGGKGMEKMEQITVSEIENKIQERMESLEFENPNDTRLKELSNLMGWILTGEDY